MKIIALLVLFAFAAPSSAQVWRETDLPVGPVVFDFTEPNVFVFVEGQTGPTSATLPPGATLTVVMNAQLEIRFYDMADRSFLGVNPTLAIADRVAMCTFVMFGGEDIAVENHCGCIAPDLVRMYPDAVDYAIDDPDVLRLEPFNLCAESGRP